MSIETSIVIRTLNEGQHLEKLLHSINMQSYTSWEVIIVDSGSTDNTLDIANKYSAKISHIPKHEFTFGGALNLGCSTAKGKYIVIVSAHTYPANNNWLSNIISPFSDPSIGMVFGKQRGVKTSRISEERDFYQTFGNASMIILDRPAGHNGNAAILRDLWEKNPFDETLTGLEDLYWAQTIQRQGYRVFYAADSTIHHVHNESITKIFRRFRGEGISFSRIFPNYRMTPFNFFKGVLKGTLGDIAYGIQHRTSIGKLLGTPVTRLAEFLGTYIGTRYRQKCRSQLSHVVPPESESISLVISSPGVHSLVKSEMPLLKDNEVLIRIAYVGVCATDIEVANGSLSYYMDGKAKFPITPGHEYSGIIAKVGDKVSRFKPGDAVVGECAIGCNICSWCLRDEQYRCPDRKEVGVVNMDGAYANYMKLPSKYLHKLPVQITLQQGALIEPTAVCIKGISKLMLDGTKNDLQACVFGAGPIGNLCCQLLTNHGIQVTVIDQNHDRLKLVEKYDANTATSIEDLSRFSYIIEATGNESLIPYLIENSRASTKILLLGLPYSPQVSVGFSSVATYDKEIYGSIASQKHDWDRAIRLVKRGEINLEDHSQTVIGLEGYRGAWDSLASNKVFKILINVAPDLRDL